MSLQSPLKRDNKIPSDTGTSKSDIYISDTSHLNADIKGHSVRGGTITIAEQAVKFFLHTISNMILGRLLTPADFGLIVMVSFFTEFVNLFKDLGLSTATIQKKDITHQQVSNLFWINIAMSIFLMLVAAAMSPFIAWFYNEPRLTLITIAIGVTFIFGGLVAQHTALMRRQMQFRILAIIEIIAVASGIIAAVIAALLHFSYWSLVIMTAVRGMTYVILIWKISSWRPGKPAFGSGVRPMLFFGGSLTGNNIMSFFIHNTDNVIVGYALGSGAAGIYTKAYGLLTLPMSQINWPLRNVMIPALSRLQDEPKQYRQFFLEVLSAVAVITMPIAAFLFIAADEIVLILLGDQWTAAVTTFRYLAPAAFLSTVSFTPGWLFISLGRVGKQLRWTMISAPVIIIGFLYGVNWGINGVAASFSITWTVMFVFYVFWACHKSPVHWYDIVKAVAVPVCSSLLAGLAAAIIGRFALELNVFIRFAIYALAFAVCYFACVMATSTGRQTARSMVNALSFLRRQPLAPVQ